MKAIFYAPMKPLTAAKPSGDQTMARQLAAALGQFGCEVLAVEGLCSYHANANEYEDKKSEILQTWSAAPDLVLEMKPDLWVTYHSYYKSPDLIGPAASAKHGLPYVIFEPSYAPNKEGSDWADALADARRSFERADLLFVMKQKDRRPLIDMLGTDEKIVDFPPFIDPRPFQNNSADVAKNPFRERFDLKGDEPIILCTAMMRGGKKLQSYRFLAAALRKMQDIPWHLVIAGDGPMRDQVQDAFDPIRPRTTFLGEIPPPELPAVYRAADIFAWPGIGEAYGMVYLEAGAAGLASIAVDSTGVREVIHNGHTGMLTQNGSIDAYTEALRGLLASKGERDRMGRAAHTFVTHDRSLKAGISRLDRLKQLIKGQ